MYRKFFCNFYVLANRILFKQIVHFVRILIVDSVYTLILPWKSFWEWWKRNKIHTLFLYDDVIGEKPPWHSHKYDL